MAQRDDERGLARGTDPAFIPGLRLCERFSEDAVRPILEAAFPDLVYSAALIGYGSDVLGYDTVRSTDHEWGPRLLLFVYEQAYADVAPRIQVELSQRLPRVFHGYSTHLGEPDADGVQVREVREAGPVNHKVEVLTPRQFCLDRLGVDPRDGLRAENWLILPQQKLLEFTAGRVCSPGPSKAKAMTASRVVREVANCTAQPSGLGRRAQEPPYTAPSFPDAAASRARVRMSRENMNPWIG